MVFAHIRRSGGYTGFSVCVKLSSRSVSVVVGDIGLRNLSNVPHSLKRLGAGTCAGGDTGGLVGTGGGGGTVGGGGERWREGAQG